MLRLCLQSSSLLSIRLLEVGKVLNHLYSRLYGWFSSSPSPGNAQKWAAEAEGNSAACAWPWLRWESRGPGRGTVWLEHGIRSSSVALVAPWRRGHGEDARLHLGEASGHGTAGIWGGYGGMEGGFLQKILSLLKLGKARGACCLDRFCFSLLNSVFEILFQGRVLGIACGLWSTCESQTGMLLSAF